MAVGTKSIRVRRIDPGMTERMLKQLRETPVVVKEASKKALRVLAVEAANYAKHHHPYEDRTGNLTRSIFGTVAKEETTGKVTAYVAAGMQYAPKIELGGDVESAWTKTRISTTGYHRQTFKTGKKFAHRPYPFLEPAAIAVVRGAQGHRILKKHMAAQRLAQGLRRRAAMK